MTIIAILAGFLILAVLRVPMAFAMLPVAIIYLLVTGTPPMLAVQRMVGGADSFTMLAAPLFILMGTLMNAMKITDKIFNFASVLVRSLPGGLAHVNVLASVVFAGMSGSMVADAGGLGQVEIKAMRKAGYTDRFSAAVTTASALIGPIIPPSIVIVLYAYLTEQSVAALFLAGIVPGLLMGGAMMVLIWGMAVTGIESCPVLPRASLSEILRAFRQAILPLMAPVILVGGILFGLFTPTEAGAVAVVYVLIIGAVGMKFDLRAIYDALKETIYVTSSLMFVLAGAAIFSWIIARADIGPAIGNLVNALSVGPISAMIVVGLIVLVLGMFMEGLPIMIILVTPLLQVLEPMGVDPIQFGIVFVTCIMFGGLTPPVGVTLYVVMRIAKVNLAEFLKAMWPFYVVIVLVLLALICMPGLTTYLPSLL